MESLRKGTVLLGQNPFINYRTIDTCHIKRSVFERMKEYIYILRKSYFNKNMETQFDARYYKFLKLSYFLLSDQLTFPEVLAIGNDEVQNILSEYGIIFTDEKKKNIEYLWEIINKQSI